MSGTGVSLRDMAQRCLSPFDKLPMELIYQIVLYAQVPRYEVVYASSTACAISPLRAYEDESDALQYAHEFNRLPDERRLQYVVFDEVMLEHGGDVCSPAAVRKMALGVMRREVEQQRLRAPSWQVDSSNERRRGSLSSDGTACSSSTSSSADVRRGDLVKTSEGGGDRSKVVSDGSDIEDVPERRPILQVIERSTSAELLSQLASLHPHWRH